jgi:hypothetical protein
MASLQERNGSFRVQFVHHGKLLGFTNGKVTRAEAGAKAAQVDYRLVRLKQKLVALPRAWTWSRSSDTTATPAVAIGPRRPQAGGDAWGAEGALPCHPGQRHRRGERSCHLRHTLRTPRSRVRRRLPARRTDARGLTGLRERAEGRRRHDPEGGRHLPGGVELGRRWGSPAGCSRRKGSVTRRPTRSRRS